jgi:hypothetical protein
VLTRAYRAARTSHLAFLQIAFDLLHFVPDPAVALAAQRMARVRMAALMASQTTMPIKKDGELSDGRDRLKQADELSFFATPKKRFKRQVWSWRSVNYFDFGFHGFLQCG